MRRLLVVGLAAIVAATMAAVGSAPRDASADHDTSVTSELPVVLAGERANEDGQARPVANGIPAIARNPTAIAQQDGGKRKWRIRVCSVPSYRKAVESAVNVWNTGVGVPIFEMLSADPDPDYDPKGDVPDIGGIRGTDCPETAPTENGEDKYIASVVVIENRNPMKQGVTGWVRTLRMNNEHYARTGQNRIYVNDGPYNRLSDKHQTAFFVHELGHTLGFSHPYEQMYSDVPGYTHPTNNGGRYRVSGCPGAFRIIVDKTTDDSGNAAAVSPRVEYPVKVVAPTQTPPRWGFTYMPDGGVKEEPLYFTENESRILSAISKSVHGGADMITHPNCWGDDEMRAGEWYFKGDVALRQYTKDVYTKVYNPAAI